MSTQNFDPAYLSAGFCFTGLFSQVSPGDSFILYLDKAQKFFTIEGAVGSKLFQYKTIGCEER